MIELRDVVKRYGASTAIDGVSLVVGRGELAVLLGPSGCGKTTTLRAINRMIEIDAGEILVDGRPVSASPPDELRRHIGYAIQSVGLFPHMTVERNIATVPRLLGWERSLVEARVRELLQLVGLAPSYAAKRPGELSGGEAQRVGVARALAADPPVLLMDEPFGALDPINRENLQREFAQLHRRLGKTVLFVTHDVEEAVLLGDRIVLMCEGRVVQDGTPEELWRAPAAPFVKEFFGPEFGLHVLSRHRVTDLPLREAPDGRAPRIESGTTLRDALALMVTEGAECVAVIGDDGAVAGGLTIEDVVTGVRRTR
ncbi:MAG TPA: ABC transporter ATP-binding protein [Coriobacteriia bacterium]|nr:ABC transporter ATP-binding protein [Coriobacteriia bacterium]